MQVLHDGNTRFWIAENVHSIFSRGTGPFAGRGSDKVVIVDLARFRHFAVT
jgi:hypothetical protein